MHPEYPRRREQAKANGPSLLLDIMGGAVVKTGETRKSLIKALNQTLVTQLMTWDQVVKQC